MVDSAMLPSGGSLDITRHELHVEMQLSSPNLAKPRLYAFALTDQLAAFFSELAKDLGDPDMVIEMQSASGAAVSPLMVHSFAWKAGRSIIAGGSRIDVAVSSEESAVNAGEGCPSPRRRTSMRPVMKYVIVSGGVVSGLGKGVTASSLGVLLKASGYRVTSIKIDPYLNIDAGTMSPFEHGEVFVLDDGGEADLDLGNYERFNNITLTRDNNITTGKIYQQCLEKERKGDYLGKTVQVVPHVTDAIQDWVERVAHIATDGHNGPPDVCVIELGGTVGDIESMPFVEALRQFQFRVKRENICFFHVTLVPVLGAVGEEKTKPSQHTVQQLRAVGLMPDFLICRSGKPLGASTKQKLANFCHVPAEQCIGVHDVSNIYRVPLLLHHQGVTDNLLRRLNLVPKPNKAFFNDWMSLAELVDSLTLKVHIAVVGKYTELSDAYLSVIKALHHASFHAERKLVIQWVDASHLVEGSTSAAYATAWKTLKEADGILVPGGFGDRGVEGKVAAAGFAREHKKPFLGICLGFQVAVIEFARSQLGHAEAHSAEFDKNTPHPLVVFMPEVSRTHMGGTMRLGSRRTVLSRPACKTAQLYGGVTAIDERHRHRYEINIDYVKSMEEKGLEFVGRDTTGERMEVFELAGHPYFVGCQFHPEFKSRPQQPSPLFVGLVHTAAGLPLP